MVRRTVTDVAWFTLAQPTAGAAGVAEVAGATEPVTEVAEPVAEAAEVAGAAACEAATEPHPASAEHSSTASTGPRTWRGDIMLLGRTPRSISSIVYPGVSEHARRDDGVTTG